MSQECNEDKRSKSVKEGEPVRSAEASQTSLPGGDRGHPLGPSDRPVRADEATSAKAGGTGAFSGELLDRERTGHALGASDLRSRESPGFGVADAAHRDGHPLTQDRAESPSLGHSSGDSGRERSAAIERRLEIGTASWQPEYWRGERPVDLRSWSGERERVMWRQQDGVQRVLGVEGWLQDKAGPALPTDRPTRDRLKGEYAGDSQIHISHGFARTFGGGVIGNTAPFPAEGNLAMSVMEKELRGIARELEHRGIAREGQPLYVQAVFHYEDATSRMPISHELAVFMRDSSGEPRLVGNFEVSRDGRVSQLRDPVVESMPESRRPRRDWIQ